MPLTANALSVLVVEDDPVLRRLYRSTLKEAGYVVLDVEDGLSALQALELHRPAAVVLDLGLPRLSGRDVHREMQSHDEMRGIPVVVVTGTDTSDLDPSEFACILRKPLQLDHLLAAIQDCIRRAQSRGRFV